MKRYCVTLILLCLAIFLAAQSNYYDSVQNLSGDELLLGLRALIHTNTYSNYNGAKAKLFQELENHDGYVTCIYTGQEFNVGYNYTGSTDPNTEHTYCQSWFGSSESNIKKADLHHLFPSEMRTNSSRGNYPIYTVANHNNATVYYTHTLWQSYRGQSPAGYTVFEPADETKGNIARALLYFYVRYNDPLVQQNVDMLPVLIQWSNQDPPDEHEITRNQDIFEFQNNRNPFIDHPEYVDRIWNPTANDEPSVPAVRDLRFIGVQPNPFNSITFFAVSSKATQEATLEIYDIRGRRVFSSPFTLRSGENKMAWDAQGLAAGIYLVKISSQNQVLTAKMVKRSGD